MAELLQRVWYSLRSGTLGVCGQRQRGQMGADITRLLGKVTGEGAPSCRARLLALFEEFPPLGPVLGHVSVFVR